MRRFSYKPFLLLGFCVFFLLSLPLSVTEKIRSFAVGSVSPGWSALQTLKVGTVKISSFFSPGFVAKAARLSGELEIVRQENVKLKMLVEQLSHELSFQVKEGSEALRARVIFRESASWSSSVWINVGERDNRKIGKEIISKNSPVVVGTSLVGVVEFVANARSRVRLITDSKLVPAVRALRGGEQNKFIREQVISLLTQIKLRPELDPSGSTLQTLGRLQEILSEEGATAFLAKGELYGSSLPLWRSRGSLLRGVGFNYDVADEYGSARVLQKGEAAMLIKAGDLLVTSGLDGVFPPNLRVGYVVSTKPSREGACSFEITAKAAPYDFDALTYVSVLPAVD